MTGSQKFFIGRQPILDRNQRLVAYELLFRSSDLNLAGVVDDVAATVNVIRHAFVDLGVEAALGPHKGFLNCDRHLLLSDMLEALPAEKMVLEVLESVDVTPEIVERCRDLKARGFTLALDDFGHVEDKFRPLLDLAEIVKVDLTLLDAGQLLDSTRKLQKWPLQLLAEKVDTAEQAAYCRRLGYTLFQGYYFARPVVISGKTLRHSEHGLIRLLGLVFEDAETGDLEKMLKQEPALMLSLMRLTNSVAAGGATKVESLRHAIDVLGRRQLQRWLQLLLYAVPAQARLATPLMELAATRGRLMELLAARLKPGQPEFENHAFMTGIMSLMPALMGTPFADILQGTGVSGEVREALEARAGDLGALLKLAEALEGLVGPEAAAITAALPGLDADTVNACLAQALSWAAQIGEH